jgi:hypothetical protein
MVTQDDPVCRALNSGASRPGNVGECSYRHHMSASVTVHGKPGQSLQKTGSRKYGSAAARRGGFIEEAAAAALEHWLTRRRDCAGLHLFHDLGGFRDVAGHGYGPVSLGTANMDHVVLSGAGWLLVDAKGTGGGTLTIDARGRGVLVQADGAERPEPWLDNSKMYSAAGVLMRLTGHRGCAVWVVPDATRLDPGVLKARAFRYGGTICSISEVRNGRLAERFPVPQPPADPEVVTALARYVTEAPGAAIG